MEHQPSPSPWDYIATHGEDPPRVLSRSATRFGNFYVASCNLDEDARLISAAPDLAALARIILTEWEAPTEGVQRGALIARLSQYAQEARDALTKAGLV